MVDDHSRYIWVEVLKTKDQDLDCFKKIKLRVEVESGEWMKALRTDRGGGESLLLICSQFSAVMVESSITPPLQIPLNRMEW